MSVEKGLRIRLRNGKISRITVGKTIGFLLLTAVAVFMALPLVYVVTTALKPLNELFYFPPRFFVEQPTLKNFQDLFLALDGLDVPFSRSVFNSVFVTVVVVALVILFTCMAAYGLVKHKVPCANLIFSLILMGMMFSPYVIQIPNYLIVNSFGMVDSYWALIIPKIAVAYNLFLVRQFVQQIPDPFLEAARIDGAGELSIFFKIVVPSLKPVIATLAVFSFVSNWNDYFTPLIFIQDEALKTLPLAMQMISSGNSIARAGAASAATFVMVLPTVLIYVLMQKHVVDSMAHSGIK
ncbi:MAG: carbohydrate ABC transporter permease [Clostridia bacterium]|nr:carbohydrate ABC transporter permease [Clostridia bacterium]